MKKSTKDQLYSELGLQSSFDNVLKKIKDEFSSNYTKLNEAEQLAHEKIELEYSKKRESLEKKEKKITDELREYLKNVEKYSTFKLASNVSNILDILAEITSLYKGEDYVVDTLKIKSYDYLVIQPKTLEIVIQEKEFLKLVDEGIILSFWNDQLDDDEVSFYEADSLGTIFESQPIQLRVSDNSLKHKFLLDFIDLVVKYRFEKKTDEISSFELKKLQQLFIYEKREEIIAIQNEKAQSERNALEKKISDRKNLLEKITGYSKVDEINSGNKLSSGKMLRKLIETYNETSS